MVSSLSSDTTRMSPRHQRTRDALERLKAATTPLTIMQGDDDHEALVKRVNAVRCASCHAVIERPAVRQRICAECKRQRHNARCRASYARRRQDERRAA